MLLNLPNTSHVAGKFIICTLSIEDNLIARLNRLLSYI